MNQNVPFVWRKNYQNEVGSNEELLETAHEKARQYLSRAAEAATRSTTYTMPLLQREIGHAKDVAQVGVGRLIRGQATAVAHPECHLQTGASSG